MLYKDLFEARKKKEDPKLIYKYCSFDWIHTLLKKNKVNSFQDTDENIKKWIAFSKKRNSLVNALLPEYGPCEIVLDKELVKAKNKVYEIKLDSEWLSKRPSVMFFITQGKFKSPYEYFLSQYKKINWGDRDEYSYQFFKKYLDEQYTLDVIRLFKDNSIEDIEDYIYSTEYVPFIKFIKKLNIEDLVLVDDPFILVNDSILEINIPKRFKEKIEKYEEEYTIKYL